MAIHLLRDMNHLKEKLLALGTMVESALDDAMKALIERRDDLAERVLEGDVRIDAKEVELEEDCLKTLALHQPVASDLRFLVMVLKVNNDLERVGDLAQNIAKRSKYLSKHAPLTLPLDMQSMGATVRRMVRDSLDCLVRLDLDLARAVCDADDEVDLALKEAYRKLQAHMMENPDSIPRALNILSAARHFERIADHATNIAEDVIFLIEGEVVRHR